MAVLEEEAGKSFAREQDYRQPSEDRWGLRRLSGRDWSEGVYVDELPLIEALAKEWRPDPSPFVTVANIHNMIKDGLWENFD